MLSSGGRLVCPPSCLLLSYLRLLPVCCLSLNAVSPGFLRNFFMCQILPPPPPPPRALLLRLAELNSIEAEIDTRKLLFLGRLVTEPKMAPSLRNLLRSRTESLFDKDVKSIGILPSICEALNKYDLFNYFEIWFNSSTFPTYGNWKSIVKNKVRDLESSLWLEFCSGHPNERTSLHPNSGPWQTFTRIWSVVFIPKSDSWVIYVLMVAFHGSLKLRAPFVLYAKKTQKRYITTLLSVPL